MSLRSGFNFLRAVVRGIVEHDILSLAAAVAFYTLLSFAPLVLLVVTVGGFIGEVAKSELVQSFYSQLGPDAAQVGQAVIAQAERAGPPREAWRWILSSGMLLVSASMVFNQLQKSLNRIWGMRASPRSGVFAWIWKRLVSMGMIFAIMFILLVAMVVSTVIEALLPRTNEVVGRVALSGVSMLVSALLFASIFKVLPDARIAWREVWLGAITTAVLFSGGKAAISWYLKHGGVVESYGSAAGALIALVVWVYYSCIILFVGAEMTAQYDQQRAAKRRAREASAIAEAAARIASAANVEAARAGELASHPLSPSPARSGERGAGEAAGEPVRSEV
ncbi:MAG: YihY/virulence factor BrkB family protein [Phycisphaeraceae bacterium]|nr:MAG: YihY/virulence factor BrkB family protein [Phycisphaeraceae bacterium]